MWAQKNILLTDIFSYTRAGAPWVNAFWLSDLLLYGLYQFGGMLALSAFVAFTAALTFHITTRGLKSPPLLNSFIIVLAALTAAPIWGPRPQILSFLLLALLDYALRRGMHTRRLLPPLFALWANLHGGWIWGFLLLIAHETGLTLNAMATPEKRTALLRESGQLFIWTLLSALAIGINPNGLSLWKLPFQQVAVSLNIQEWLSPDFHRIDFHPFLWMLFLLVLTAPAAPRPINWPQIFKTLGFAYMTFIAQRNIAPFAITAAPLLAEWSDSALTPFKQKRFFPPSTLKPRLTTFINAAILLILVILASTNLVVLSQPSRLIEHYPTYAVHWLKANHPTGRLFNSYNWGGYLTWALPEYPVFIDGRADLYGNDLIAQWQEVVNAGPKALSILDAWQIDLVLLEPYWSILPLLEEKGWRVLYQDQVSVLLARP